MTNSDLSNIETYYPLAPLQQGLLFHHIYAPESDLYCDQNAVRLEGNLNIAHFVKAWDRVVQRHAILRTSFLWKETREPVQVVHGSLRLQFAEHDWRGIPVGEQEKRLNEFREADRKKGFDLAKPPLMRLAMIRTDDNIYELTWTCHHILLDGWSVSIILSELFAFYGAICQGGDITLEPARPYKDYIKWLKTLDLTAAEDFWRDKLKGFDTPTVLGIEENVASGRSADASVSERTLCLPRSLAAGLESFTRDHHITLNTLLLGAWGLLICRYGAQDDIVFGCTSAGRPPTMKGIESMTGLFINTLPVRVQAPRNRLVVAWLQELQKQLVQQRQFEYAPLYEIQKWSDVPSDESLFNNLVIFENYPGGGLKAATKTLEITDLKYITRTSYPLNLWVTTGNEIQLRITYDSPPYTSEAVEGLLNHFETLLSGFVANPHCALDQVPMLSGSELHRLLKDWNNTGSNYVRESSLHELFVRRGERTPDAIALASEDAQLSFRELNLRSNQLAHYLMHLNVKPRDLVAIYMDRSAEMVIAMMGVLKAGAAYVPLDPIYPKHRIAFIIEDAEVPLVLTQRRLVDQLPDDLAKLICVDSDWEGDLAVNRENPVSQVSPSDLAYVIYTSGSTGKPKGVEISHGAVVNFLHSMADEPGMDATDVLLAVTTMSFDISVLEIFLPLVFGSRVELVGADSAVDAYRLMSRLQSSRATIMQATPTTWRMLVEAGWQGSPDLKILCGGEAMPRELSAALLPKCASLWNMYGPTETTIWSAVHHVSSGSGSIPIGRPIANTEFFVLDADYNPVPIGVPGELFIGGDGVAQGYRNRSDLTAEKFVPCPFNGRGNARLYRTGDLVRYLPDSSLDFLERKDHQIKIRGFRIELGEIEFALRRHSAVSAVVVIVREDNPGDKRLVAYIVPGQGERPAATSLRSFLKEDLPDYMVPTNYVFIDQLPLTPNGKIDRNALPVPERARPELDDSFVARNPYEEVVAETWADILGLEKVGLHDNFFELGGHSLLAMRIVSRLSQVFEIPLQLPTVFDSPTVSDMAAVIARIKRSEDAPVVGESSLATMESSQSTCLSYSEQRQWILDQWDPGTSAYNIPVTVRLRGRPDVDALEKSFQEVQARHETLRTIYRSDDEQTVQRMSSNRVVKLPLVDLRELAETPRQAEVERLAEVAAHRSFDLTTGPLWHIVLLQLDEDHFVLQLTMHHIITDGWSMGILFRELSELYAAISAGKPSPLPELPIQYADFAAWQRRHLQGRVLEQLLSFWKKQLQGAPSTLELPTDRPRPAILTYRGARHALTIPKSANRAIKKLGREEGTSLFMTLLAAFQTLLSRYSHQEDISVGTFLANRNQLETEKLIGFFTNNLVLRLDLSGNPSFRELLARVRKMTLGAYMHQDLPFEKLLEELHPQRDASRTPLFQVMFVMLNNPESVLELPGVTSQHLHTDIGRSEFDMTLWIKEVNEELYAELEYNVDLFDSSTAEQILKHFEKLLQGVVENPEQRLLDIPLEEEPEVDNNSPANLPVTDDFLFST